MNQNRPSLLLQIGAIWMSLAVVATFLIVGVISGIQPPFEMFGMRFEGGYKADPSFFATLTPLVLAIVPAILIGAGLNLRTGPRSHAVDVLVEEKPTPPSMSTA
jgi:hypothetical protein